MNDDIDLSAGLTGVAVGALVRKLRHADPKNPVAWFCLFQILLEIQKEWDNDAMAADRFQALNDALLDPIRRVLSSMEIAHPNFNADLRALVVGYRAFFYP